MSVHTQDCHVPGIVFSGFCVIWISLSEGDQDKTNTPSSLFLSSMNLDVGEALVNKDAESHRGIVWLRLIRPKQTTGKFWNVCHNKELELRGRRKGRGELRGCKDFRILWRILNLGYWKGTYSVWALE